LKENAGTPAGLCYRVEATWNRRKPVGEQWRVAMKWMKPTIEEICIGLEINDYFPAEL
jgi:coenzyme PQQ precursor peptide PqqA